MAEKFPDTESIERRFPSTLKPREDGPRFPELTKKDLLELADEGWERIGVVVLLVNPSGQVIVVEHGPNNPKVKEGTRGVISETITFDANTIEQPVECISRLFSEELGLSSEDIQRLNLQTVENGAWQNVKFPLPGDRDAFGLVTVLRADQASADIISRAAASGSPRGESILFGGFVGSDRLADGTGTKGYREEDKKLTQKIFAAGMDLLTTPRKLSRLELPPPKELSPHAIENLKDLLP